MQVAAATPQPGAHRAVTCGATTCPIGWMFLTAEEYLYCGAPRGRLGEEGTRLLTVCVPMLAATGMGTFVRRCLLNALLHQGGRSQKGSVLSQKAQKNPPTTLKVAPGCKAASPGQAGLPSHPLGCSDSLQRAGELAKAPSPPETPVCISSWRMGTAPRRGDCKSCCPQLPSCSEARAEEREDRVKSRGDKPRTALLALLLISVIRHSTPKTTLG